MRKYSSSHKRLKLSRVLIILAVVISIVAVFAVVMVRKSYYDHLKPVSASQKTQLVTVPLGSSVKETGVILQQQGVIKAGWAFEWYVRNNNLRDEIQAGTYYLRPNQSTQEITNILTQGKVATDLVTILPGQRLDQIRSSLINAGFSEKAVDAALNPAKYKDHPALVDKPEDASLEGYLFPESFQKTAETSPETVVKASLDEMQKTLTPALRAAMVRQGLTVHQGIILASIVDQEVSDLEDKKTVAQVFLKRLKEDIALESDPTAVYGAVKNGQEPSLSYDSPYNTYKYKGLPPGPISNVSKAGLEAVASPSSTDYLFFVAGDDGTTYFSKTLKEHERLTKEHCTKLCAPQ